MNQRLLQRGKIDEWNDWRKSQQENQTIDLNNANFSRRNLSWADLKDVDLRNATLINTIFHHAELQNANLEGANLKGADLKDANLEGANLKGANLDESINVNPTYLKLWRIVNSKPLPDNLDLSNFNLKGANLKGANLKGANLKGANLTGANLKGANLMGADLMGANLMGADLEGVKFKGCNLDQSQNVNPKYLIIWQIIHKELNSQDFANADLEGARLQDANLKGANLKEANLQNANLNNARLQGANLKEADLKEADLEGANLQNANLEKSDLGGANLKETNLKGANLKGADLRNAEVKGAILKNVNLENAQLEGVDLTTATLSKSILENNKWFKLFHSNVVIFYGLYLWSLFYGKTYRKGMEEITITSEENLSDLFNKSETYMRVIKDNITLSCSLLTNKLETNIYFQLIDSQTNQINLIDFNTETNRIEHKPQREIDNYDKKRNIPCNIHIANKFNTDQDKWAKRIKYFFLLNHSLYDQVKNNFFLNNNCTSKEVVNFFDFPYFYPFEYKDDELRPLLEKFNILLLWEEYQDFEQIKEFLRGFLQLDIENLKEYLNNKRRGLEEIIKELNLNNLDDIIKNCFNFLRDFLKLVVAVNVAQVRQINLKETFYDLFFKKLRQNIESVSLIKAIIISPKNTSDGKFKAKVEEYRLEYECHVTQLSDVINNVDKKLTNTYTNMDSEKEIKQTNTANNNFYLIIENSQDEILLNHNQDSQYQAFKYLREKQYGSPSNSKSLYILRVEKNKVFISFVDDDQSRSSEILNQIKLCDQTIGSEKEDDNSRRYDLQQLKIFLQEKDKKAVNFKVKLAIDNLNLDDNETILNLASKIQQQLKILGGAGTFYNHAIIEDNIITLSLESYPIVFSSLKSLKEGTEILPDINFISLEEITPIPTTNFDSAKVAENTPILTTDFDSAKVEITPIPSSVQLLESIGGKFNNLVDNGWEVIQGFISPPPTLTLALVDDRSLGERGEKIDLANLENNVISLIDTIKNGHDYNTLKIAIPDLGITIKSNQDNISQNLQEDAIACLVEFIEQSDQEMLIRKAVDSLHKIFARHPVAIATLTQFMYNAKDELIKIQTAEKLGTIDDGNQDAITCLVGIILDPENDDHIWIAAESLNKISPEEGAKVTLKTTKETGFYVEDYPLKISLSVAKFEEDNANIMLKLYLDLEQKKEKEKTYFPSGLQLILLDESGQEFKNFTVNENKKINFYDYSFKGTKNEGFTIKVAYNSNVVFTESLFI
jgi:uncharacterized protein YjbI with pentapeptide repeats